ILDTAGRLHVDEELMDELAAVRDATRPTNVLLVLDSMTGQDAVRVAEAFAERVAFDGIVLTKLDGDARGGAALSVKAVTGKPIKLASVGERFDQLEYFHPDRMASRILGMGDVLTLVEKAEAAAGAPLPARDRRLPPAADRDGQRHERPAGEPAAGCPQADGEDDETAREGQDAGAPRPASRAEWAFALRHEEEEGQAQEIEITEVIVWQSS